MSAATDSTLWQPIRVGNLTLSHRLVMAPLTRFRNDAKHAPNELMFQYYTDRACVPGSLIITEATGTSGEAEGMPHLPAIYNEDQAAGWKRIYEGIHARGSFVFQQLWDLGRAGLPEYIKSRGYSYKSSSAEQQSDRPVAPEPLSEEEIWQRIDDFRQAAKKVIAAGGDGVEIHAAHGYLIDQFTRDSVNKRTDKWGGSVENRARFLLEVVKAVVEEIGAERTALRLSPFALFQESYSTDTWEQTGYIVRRIKEAGHKLAYLSLVEPRQDPYFIRHEIPPTDVPEHFGTRVQSLDFIMDLWDNMSPIVVAGGYEAKTAMLAVDERYKGRDVMVAIGRYFISNPDLVFRVKNQIAFAPYNRSTFYIYESHVGYNDYPFSKEALEAGLIRSSV